MNTRSLLLAVAVTVWPMLASAAPDWCKPMAGKSSSYFDPSAMEDESDARKATQAIAFGICNPRDPADTPKAEAARKKWSALLDMNDADWLGATHYWATYDQYAEAPTPNKKGYAGLDPLDQYVFLSTYANVSPDGFYVADAMSPLSEVGRVGFAIYCVRNWANKDAALAACVHDIAAVDIKKASSEIRADKAHEPKIGYMARTFWWNHKKGMEDMKAAAEKLKKGDPAYGKMFDIADKAFSSWDANAAKRAKLISLAGDMDNMRETQSRKAQEGCEDKTVAELRTAVGTIPADHFTSVLNVETKMSIYPEVARGIASTPEGYLAAAAFVNCTKVGMDYNSDSSFLTLALGDALVRWPGYRGPRSAAIADIMQAGLELDERGKEIGYPDLHRDFFGDGHPMMNTKPDKSGIGVIASVKPAGKVATVSYQNQKVSYPVCVDYKAGTKITGIMSNGQFERAGTCYKYKTVNDTVAVGAKPADARFVNGLKPGQFSVLINAIPYASWMPNAKAPATILGVPVK